jgi:deaminated glutathione amidase
MIPAPLTIAAVQLQSTDDRARNLERAAQQGAMLVATPENSDHIAPREVKLAQAEPLDGPFVTALRTKAKELVITLLLGSFGERIAGSARVHNTSLLIGPTGEILSLYRKIHLFDADTADGARYRESEAVEPGGDVVSCETPLGIFGQSICYDLRFPELYRALSKRGCDVLFVPSAFTVPTGRAHWEILLRARAIENLAYVVAPAQVGDHGNTRRSWGHSLIVDPWGTVLADAGGESDGLAIATIDPAELARVRGMLPALSHRRL